MKAIHEFYHGLICKRHGGQVPVCGIALILFSPVAFVDVTSSWKFRSKWQRIYTAAGGMYAELFVASLTALLWANSDDGLLSQICHNVIVMASVSTLLFNGNFLMRFDGYYICLGLAGHSKPLWQRSTVCPLFGPTLFPGDTRDRWCWHGPSGCDCQGLRDRVAGMASVVLRGSRADRGHDVSWSRNHRLFHRGHLVDPLADIAFCTLS